VQALQTIS